jgi:formamidopyrimidine-DNA glycosylase
MENKNHKLCESFIKYNCQDFKNWEYINNQHIEHQKEILSTIENVLKESYNLQGASLMTYRDADGNEGGFENFLQVYGKNQINNMKVIKEETLDKRTTWWVPEVQK